MLKTPAFWAAVRLCAFANIAITRQNFRTLWPSRAQPEGKRRRGARLYLGTRPMRANWSDRVGTRTIAIRRSRTAYTGAHLELRLVIRALAVTRDAERVTEAELWNAYRSEVQRAARCIPPTSIEIMDAVIRLRETPVVDEAMLRDAASLVQSYPLQPWPQRSAGKVPSGRELLAIQALVRRRLESISGDEDLSTLVRELSRRRVKWEVEAFALPGAARLSARSIVFGHNRQLPTDLRQHIDDLFRDSAVGDMWSSIRRCSGPGCGRYFVAKISGARPLFCSNDCKNAHHSIKRQKNKMSEREEVARTGKARIEALRATGITRLAAAEQAAKELRVSMRRVESWFEE